MSAVLDGAVLETLRGWLPADDAVERPRVQLATIDGAGFPDLRTVLLSEWDERGLVFHTDTASRKAAHLTARPQAAMLLLEPGFTRQLTVQGAVVPHDGAAAADAYARRPPYLQVLAWQNTAETALLPRSERALAWHRFLDERGLDGRGDGPLDPPATWGGFVLQPHRVTFWEADVDGPSHRTEHRRGADGAWTVHHLPG